MTGIDVSTAKDIGLVLVTVAVMLALVGLWVLKTVVAKVLTVLVLGGAALAVWTQRADLQECAGRMQATGASTTCSFFGAEVALTDTVTPP